MSRGSSVAGRARSPVFSKHEVTSSDGLDEMEDRGGDPGTISRVWVLDRAVVVDEVLAELGERVLGTIDGPGVTAVGGESLRFEMLRAERVLPGSVPLTSPPLSTFRNNHQGFPMDCHISRKRQGSYHAIIFIQD